MTASRTPSSQSLPIANGTWPSFAGSLLSTGIAATPVAILFTIALHGRTTVTGLSLKWASTFTLIAIATAAWSILARTWVRHGTIRPSAISRAIPGSWRGLLPAAIVAGIASIATYASDDLFHALAHEPRLAGILLPATVLLAGASPWFADRRVRIDTIAIDRRRDLMTIATLLATGVATTGAWHVVATDDLLRYWAISDSIRASAPYFVTDGVPGDGSFYIVDLPGYPILASLAYEVIGHTYAALRTPAILASSLLPLAVWASVRAVGAGRVWALALSLSLVTLPHLRTYVVGAAQPDGLLATFMATFLAFLVKSAPAIRGTSPLNLMISIGTGIFAAAAVLTRPEGALLVGSIGIGALATARPRRWSLTTWRNLSIGIAGAIFPILAFSSVIHRDLGIIWPGGWGSIASTSFIAPNVAAVIRTNLPWYAEAIGLPRTAGLPISACFVVASVAGMALLVRRVPILATAPLAVGLSLMVIFCSPTYLTGDLFSPATFFRHIAASLPCVAVALATLGPRAGTTNTLIKSIAPIVFIMILIGNSYILGTATDRLRRGELTIYPQEPVLTAMTLWNISPPLPILKIIDRPTNGSTFDTSFNYMLYRNTLWSSVENFHQHRTDAPRGWAIATVILTLGGIIAVSMHRNENA